MNFIDFFIVVPLAWGLYKGFTRGLITEAASLVAFGGGVWGGIHFSDFMAHTLSSTFGWQSKYMPVISFALVFLGIIILVFFLSKLILRMVDGIALSGINKILGAVFGTLKFALLLSVIIFVLDAVEKSYPIITIKSKDDSLLYRPLGKLAPTLIPALKESDMDKIFKEE